MAQSIAPLLLTSGALLQELPFAGGMFASQRLVWNQNNRHLSGTRIYVSSSTSSEIVWPSWDAAARSGVWFAARLSRLER
jgi:hypothetical protein